MKIPPGRSAEALAQPDRWRIVLLHGPDAGFIRERADALVRTVIGSADDPFRLAVLGRDDLAQLPAEMTALALTGGRRVVRVPDIGDAALSSIHRALATPGEALLIVEAGDLPSRSKLRAAVEAMADGAVIACYHEEGAALVATLGKALRQRNVTISDPALQWLADRSGIDRKMTAGNLETLALYSGDGGHVEIDDAHAALGDGFDGLAGDVIAALLTGQFARLDRALVAALSGGLSSVGLLRQALGALHSQERATLAPDRRAPPYGRPMANAGGRLWPLASIRAAIAITAEAERACKRTGAADDLICRTAMMRIAALVRRDPGRHDARSA